MSEYTTVNILMVDDDSIDVEMFRRSLKHNRIANPLHVACDGEEAIAMLRERKIEKPLLIVLDLNMPRMNGIEFLHELRADDVYKDSIVFVMTTSDADKDKVEAYNFNIAGYMVKSELGENFIGAVNLLDQYWNTIQLPT